MNDRAYRGVLAVVVCIGALMCVYVGWHAYRTNCSFGFPLDDPWIHLQFAKNLHDYGSYSYFKDEMVTSGSTSPLYTFLLALGFFVTDDEMLLSYFWGITFFLLAAVFLYKISLNIFDGNNLMGIAAAFLLLFEPRLQWIALSGMETTLFIFLMILTFYYYKNEKSVPLGITSGLLLWTRPEAVIFFSAIIADILYNSFVLQKDASKYKSQTGAAHSLQWMKRSFFIVVVVVAGYFVFNLMLSDSLFPNTYAAKIKYYSGSERDFPNHVYHFLRDGHLSILSFFAVLGMLTLVNQVLQRQAQSLLIPFLWSLGMFLAFWYALPYLYQEGRYLMPILPFVILLGLFGVQITMKIVQRFVQSLTNSRTSSLAVSFVCGAFFIQFAVATWEGKDNYAEYCKYITDRQVTTAKWLRDHLPDDAIIATHDIGAIAFYSNRKIADMVGLVSPEMIPNIRRFDKLIDFLMRKSVTHLAVLRNWFEVTNQNPIYQTDERYPEIMEVFKFDPTRIHFTPHSASRMAEAARFYISVRDLSQAKILLEQSLRLDPEASTSHYLLAKVYQFEGNLDKAEAALETALRLHPDLWDAQCTLAEIAALRGKPREAVERLESVVQKNPSYAEGYRVLAEVYRAFHLDSVKSTEYLQRYQQLTSDISQ
ncbi:MAG: tetratricopeptide repeat protein [Ignavibacteriae bacterium]|nr:tetratricopeptide repeat protein [Ignavibacteriota bacterium]